MPARAFAHRLPLVPLVAALAGFAACDPCAGVAACSVEPRLGVGGQIVERTDPTGAPVRGARVEVIRTGGVELSVASGSSLTDGTGWWHVSLPARDTGTVVADVSVTPAGGGTPYVVRGVALRASRARGEGNVLGRWTHHVFISALGEVLDRDTGARLGGARVTAVRVAGAEIAPTPNTRSPMVTDEGSGRYFFELRPLSPAPVVLDFTIARDGLPPTVVRNVVVEPGHEWLPPNVNGNLIFRVPTKGGPG